MKKTLLFGALLTAMLTNSLATWGEVGDEFESSELKFKVTSEEEGNLTCSVTSLVDGFEGTELVIPTTATKIVAEGDDVEYSVTSIGDFAFSAGSSLTSISIPASIESIGKRVFNSCSNLQEINVAEENEHYSSLNGALYNKDQTIFIKYPAGKDDWYFGDMDVVKEIMEFAFSNSKLGYIYLPQTVEKIGEKAMLMCNNLQEVNIPSSVTSMGLEVFRNCENLWIINIDEENPAYTAIDNIIYNKDITELIFCPIPLNKKVLEVPGSVTTIKDFAFGNNRYINCISLPNSLTKIYNNAFSNCQSLKAIYSFDSDAPTFYGKILTDTKIYVPENAVETYKQTWSSNSDIIFAMESDQTIVDTEDYSKEFNAAEKVTYKRTFTTECWQPLYIPFSMNYEEWSDWAEVAELSGVHMYDDGKTVIEFLTVKEGEKTVANVPYVIKPKTEGGAVVIDEEMVKEFPKKVIYSHEDAFSWVMSCSTTRYEYYFNGVNEFGYVGQNTYVLGDNNTFGHPEFGTLAAGRFYIFKSQKNGGYWGAPAKDEEEIYIMIDGKMIEGDVTGLVNIVRGDAEGYYDLQGRKIEAPQNGIFIHNGKKVVVK